MHLTAADFRVIFAFLRRRRSGARQGEKAESAGRGRCRTCALVNRYYVKPSSAPWQYDFSNIEGIFCGPEGSVRGFPGRKARRYAPQTERAGTKSAGRMHCRVPGAAGATDMKSRTFFKVRLELKGGTRSGSIIKVKADPPDMENEARRLREKGLQGPGIIKKTLPNISARQCWWGKVDSNHRRHCQQIYSLSPLATREFPHIEFCYVLELVDGLEPPTC